MGWKMLALKKLAFSLIFSEKMGIMATAATKWKSFCHIISLVDVIGFSLYNRYDSRMDDRTN